MLPIAPARRSDTGVLSPPKSASESTFSPTSRAGRKGGRLRSSTGCVTCRIRRVKCDEGKPFCNRCASTGRKCDGYKSPPSASRESALTFDPYSHLPGHEPHGTHKLTELRALQFFCEVVAPSIAKPYNRQLWNKLVLQLSGQEAAARHSVIAISALYEDFYCNKRDISELKSNRFALLHYNAAIRNVTATKDEGLILVVCLLFVCIETLEGNFSEVLRHSQHGLQILKNVQDRLPWVKDNLWPVFRRLSVLPLYFGLDGFPEPPGIRDPLPDTFSTLDEAIYFGEGLLVRTIQLSRLGFHYPYRRTAPITLNPELFTLQDEVQRGLEKWHTAFAEFEMHRSKFESSRSASNSCLIQILTCEIWASIAHTPGEGVFDSYFVTFRKITKHAELLGRSMYGRKQAPSDRLFTFEWGYLPILVYVVSKCRDLVIRLQALQLIRRYGPLRESLWQRDTLYVACRRLIEVEHGLVLDNQDHPVGQVDWGYIPSVEERIEDLTSFLPR
ncbi:hypothetical protein BX600DRAFT_476960 [Xylariales sp. PMI_506]|nr:hypothetical protein BX600DRAFT_476960 [Xylariales sp. PMI_506]